VNSLFFRTLRAYTDPKYPLNFSDVCREANLEYFRNQWSHSRKRQTPFTLQRGEKTRVAHAGSLIPGGQSGKSGILLKAAFQIDEDDLFKRRLLKSLVVRASFKTS
jgi:hypothetical protein